MQISNPNSVLAGQHEDHVTVNVLNVGSGLSQSLADLKLAVCVHVPPT